MTNNIFMIYKLLIALLIISTSICHAQQAKKNIVFKVRKHPVTDEVVVEKDVPEFSATFQGGNVDDFRNWVQFKIVYPESAINTKISGKVLAAFTVNSKGKVVDVKIVRGIHNDIDAEVIKVISSSPEWVPGKLDGMAVKQQFLINVLFSIQ